MDSEGLSASALADLAGVTAAEVRRLLDLGVLAGRDAAGPFLASDAQKVRLAEACERARLPMEGIAAAIADGRLSFGFLEAAPYRRWAVRSARTYRQVSQDTGIPLDLLGGVLESMGFARMAPDEPIREDELEDVVPLLELARSMGSLDRGLARIGRAYAQGLRIVAAVEKEDYTARFARLVRESGADRWTARERAAGLATELLPLVDRVLMAVYRRQQELVWTEDLVEDIENELEAAGLLARPERVPAMCLSDLVGYTRLTEERGDRAAAALAEALGALVERSSREHGGEPVKSLGDGVMVHFRDSGGAVLAGLAMVERLPAARLPPAHVGGVGALAAGSGGERGRQRLLHRRRRLGVQVRPWRVVLADHQRLLVAERAHHRAARLDVSRDAAHLPVQVQVEHVEEVPAVAQQHVEELPLRAVGGAGRQPEGRAAAEPESASLTARCITWSWATYSPAVPAHSSPTLDGSLSHCQ
jgi:adenylate cyclase